MATATKLAIPDFDESRETYRAVSKPQPLPEPSRLWSRKVFGPSAVFTALVIGSGELVFWPRLSMPYGAGVLWIALAAVAIQYVIDIEIGRYSLATGCRV